MPKRTCFVIMPFKEELWEVYEKAIKPACQKAGFDSLRVDEINEGPFNINKKIVELIFTSDAIVADLSGFSANVFYELGIAHTIDHKTVMIIQENTPPPFDVRVYHCIQYGRTAEGLKKLSNDLFDSLSRVEAWKSSCENPVLQFYPKKIFVHRVDSEKAMQQLQNEQSRALQQWKESYERKIEVLKGGQDSPFQIKKVRHRDKIFTRAMIFLFGLVIGGGTWWGFSKFQKPLTLEEHTALPSKQVVEEDSLRKAEVADSTVNGLDSTSILPSSNTFEEALVLRSLPTNLSRDEVGKFLALRGFYDSTKNTTGRGIKHSYKVDSLTVLDSACGLIWEKGGTLRHLKFAQAEEYVHDLNERKFANYSDWRLPTIEEAMSLMATEKSDNTLYIDSAFDTRQKWIWTADTARAGKTTATQYWVCSFSEGSCYPNIGKKFTRYVRAVRTYK